MWFLFWDAAKGGGQVVSFCLAKAHAGKFEGHVDHYGLFREMCLGPETGMIAGAWVQSNQFSVGLRFFHPHNTFHPANANIS